MRGGSERIRWFAGVALFPGTLSGALVATALLVDLGVGPALSVGACALAASVPILAAQKLLPYRTAWRMPRDSFLIDLMHYAGTGLTSEAVRAVTAGLTVWASVALQQAVGGTLWPARAPVVVQFLLALVLCELGAYAVHRACHTWPLLWRVHAMHHTSERLTVMSAGRNHPLNVVLTFLGQMVPLAILGAGPLVLALVSVFTVVHGMLQHANVAFRHGPFNLVFTTADLHRWHHSPRVRESSSNFGSNLAIWDYVFRTRYLPEDRCPEAAGLGPVAVPENYLVHLAVPFRATRSD